MDARCNSINHFKILFNKINRCIANDDCDASRLVHNIMLWLWLWLCVRALNSELFDVQRSFHLIVT